MADALQLGTGGLLALMVIREVLAFLAKRKNGNGHNAGEMAPSYWTKDYRDAVREVTAEQIAPRLERIERQLERLLERPS